MPMFVVNISDSDRVYLNSVVATITAVVPRLAARYSRRKSDFLSHDDIILVEEVKSAVEGLLRQLMRFGVFISSKERSGSWGSALEATVKLNDVWANIKTDSAVDVAVLEEMMLCARVIKSVLDARIASGKWL
ncbi:hypothetical protein HY485_02495 [Candidatus Woesearchaeota archaeon]|nr:hypothetical protein [Candidatus Woesearchaeota archaeon]